MQRTSWTLPCWCLAWMVLLFSGRAEAQVLNRDTIKPLLVADVNALQANRYFVQSMLAFNSTPFTVGYATQQARAKLLRIDGEIVDGGLAKDQLVLSVGGGRPLTGFAAYGVLNFAGATASDFPRIPMSGNYNKYGIRATHAAAFLALGVAYEGWVVQYGYSFNQLRVHSDQYGRLTYCGDSGTCSNTGLPTRPGAPNPVILENNKRTVSNRLLTVESQHGYSLGALLANLKSLQGGDNAEGGTSLGALRLVAQPDVVQEMTNVAFGVGLNTYAKEIDYYGDQMAAADAAAREGREPPQRKRGIVEVPLLADRILASGFTARIVGQFSPTLLARLAEVGYMYEGDGAQDFVPNAAIRGKLFRRGADAEFSADVYAGFFWTMTRSTTEQQGRGVSLFATYSYNSPDSSNFMPLARAHVIGAQLVWGNPAALAPPIPSVEVPQSARFEGGSL